MGVLKDGQKVGSRGSAALPRSVRVYPSRSSAATECRQSHPLGICGREPEKPGKSNAPCHPPDLRTNCLIRAHAYLGVMTVHFPFENTYAALPAGFFARV